MPMAPAKKKPPGEKLVLRTFHIAPDEQEASKALASKAGISWAAWVRQAVREKISRDVKKNRKRP